MGKTKKIFSIYFLLLFLFGCRQPVLFEETRLAMDTVAEISVYGVDKNKALEAIREAFGEIKRIEEKFNRFDAKSEISMVNRLGGQGAVNISPELFKLIEDSLYYSKISNGTFDITVLPSQRGRYEEIILDRGRSSVRFLAPDIRIDMGGIVKGYAADRAKDILTGQGIENALINIGGNIYALGNAMGKKEWEIGIQDPRDKYKIIDKLKLKDKAVSTSGDYERGLHIIDPSTGRPAGGVISVTVVADSAEESDALSTAIFVMGPEKAKGLIKSLRENIEVFIVDNNGSVIRYP